MLGTHPATTAIAALAVQASVLSSSPFVLSAPGCRATATYPSGWVSGTVRVGQALPSPEAVWRFSGGHGSLCGILPLLSWPLPSHAS